MPLWSEKILDVISIILNLSRQLACGLWRMFHVYLRRLCILLFLDGMSCRYLLSAASLMVHFKASVPLLIFCLDDLPSDVIGMLKCPTMFVLLSVSSFISVYVCVYSYIGHIYVNKCNLFLYGSLYHYIIFNALVCLMAQTFF